MSDNRAVGVFDSGLGGLTAVRALRELLPGENVVYFGDCARVPYGNKSHSTIEKYARQDYAFLKSRDCKAVICACGTASSVGLAALDTRGGPPVFGVIESTAKAAVAASRGRIGIIGTAASIHSGAYARAIARLSPEAKIISKATPLLVPLVENGRTDSHDRLCEMVLHEYLDPMLADGIDALILGCTHYPLLRPVISKICGRVELIDPCRETVKQFSDYLRRTNSLAQNDGSMEFYVSDSAEEFTDNCKMYLDSDSIPNAIIVDVERFN